MENQIKIELHALEPSLRMCYVLGQFRTLEKGESMILISNQDPADFYRELGKAHGGKIGWSFPETGPERWSAVLEKVESSVADQTIASVVTNDIRKARVFRKYGIDFCCGGKKSLGKVCAEKNIVLNDLLRDLEHVAAERMQPVASAAEWKLDFLADYIVNVHHSFVRRILPDLINWSTKVARVHSEEHPETIEIASLFSEVAMEMSAHMIKEENVLFPYIAQLQQSVDEDIDGPEAHFGTVSNPISRMEDDHEQVGELMHRIAALSANYTPPQNACNTYRALYAGLKDFEEDLFIHIHLENNILFPKAIQLEQMVTA